NTQVYHRNVENWLAWTPENGIWSASNIQNVESKGIDNRTQISFFKKKTAFSIVFWHSYNSTIRKSGDLTGKYLIYVAPFSYGTNCSFRFKKVSLLIQQNYQSWRFLTADNSDFLDPYTVWNIILKGNHKFGNIFFEINNLFNKNYETVANYPMPLRNARLGIMLKINKSLFKSKSLNNKNP
ncbi:MAG: TonB-dependent receptor, partial [Cytophagales bacterium]